MVYMLFSHVFESGPFSPPRPARRWVVAPQRAKTKGKKILGARPAPLSLVELPEDAITAVVLGATASDKTTLRAARVCRAFHATINGVDVQRPLKEMGVVHGIGNRPPIKPLLKPAETTCAPPPRVGPTGGAPRHAAPRRATYRRHTRQLLVQ